ncbi:cupredoxin domain-containing protein [uncultured Alsobacter sp.]|uniref:cupredoxin domain-containing protein n=1 Tax=uncultured Alsobacter sp. TaxID=1748258 RepID=UPI0025D14729|nr:cupredoxin domain-containing protein [uncultured Alsobacter sp.]
MGRWRLSAAVVATALAVASPGARAEDDPTFRIEFRDGQVKPARLAVPARTRIRLELVNLGTTPAEFESNQLRKEKVLAPGTTAILVIRTLDPGQYDFFDDFYPDAPPAVLVAE